MNRKIITILILLIFSFECTGIEHLVSVLYAKGSTLRPMATVHSGQRSDEVTGLVKSSSAGGSKRKLSKPKGKGEAEPGRETNALSALIFVLGTAGAFYISLKLTNRLLIISAATFITAAGILGAFGMLGGVVMFIPMRMKKRLIAYRNREEEEMEKQKKLLSKAMKVSMQVDTVLQKVKLRHGADVMLNNIFRDNNPDKFSDYASFKKAIEDAVSSQLSQEQRNIDVIKKRIRRFLKKQDYFAQKQADEEQRRKQEELRKAQLAEERKEQERIAKLEVEKRERERIARLEKKREEQERIAKIEKEKQGKERMVIFVREGKAKLDSLQGRLEMAKEQIDAELARLKEESIKRLRGVDWTAISGPVEYTRRLKEAIAKEVKDDPETIKLLDILRTDGVERIDRRNKHLHTILIAELSKLMPDKIGKRDKFFVKIARIEKRFTILPTAETLIRAKKQEWRRYEESDYRANVLDGAFLTELSVTERKRGLHNLKSSREFMKFIETLPFNQKNRWTRKYDESLAQEYFEITKEHLQELRSGGYVRKILKSKPVAGIDEILSWLREKFNKYDSKEMKQMYEQISKQLYDIKKRAGADVPMPSSRQIRKVPNAAGAVVDGALKDSIKEHKDNEALSLAALSEDIKSTFNTVEELFKEDKTFGGCCTLFLMLYSLQVTKEFKARYKRLKDNLGKLILVTAKSHAEDEETLSTDEKELLRSLPKIVSYIYVIASLVDGNKKVAGIFWRDMVATPEFAESLDSGKIDAARLQRVYTKLTEELGMPSPSELKDNPEKRNNNLLDDLQDDMRQKSSSAGTRTTEVISAELAGKKALAAKKEEEFIAAEEKKGFKYMPGAIKGKTAKLLAENWKDIKGLTVTRIAKEYNFPATNLYAFINAHEEAVEFYDINYTPDKETLASEEEGMKFLPEVEHGKNHRFFAENWEAIKGLTIREIVDRFGKSHNISRNMIDGFLRLHPEASAFYDIRKSTKRIPGAEGTPTETALLGHETIPLTKDLLEKLPAMSIGERIKAIRNFMGLKQADVYRKAGLKRNTYSNLERIKAFPDDKRLKNLLKVAKMLGVDIILILKGRSWDEIYPDLTDGEKVFFERLRNRWTREEFINKLEQAGLKFTTDRLDSKTITVWGWEKGRIPRYEEQKRIIRKVLNDNTLYRKAGEPIVEEAEEAEEEKDWKFLDGVNRETTMARFFAKNWQKIKGLTTRRIAEEFKKSEYNIKYFLRTNKNAKEFYGIAKGRRGKRILGGRRAVTGEDLFTDTTLGLEADQKEADVLYCLETLANAQAVVEFAISADPLNPVTPEELKEAYRDITEIRLVNALEAGPDKEIWLELLGQLANMRKAGLIKSDYIQEIHTRVQGLWRSVELDKGFKTTCLKGIMVLTRALPSPGKSNSAGLSNSKNTIAAIASSA